MAAAESQNADARAYAQWAAFNISYQGTGTLVIQNASLSWGKWYNYPDKDQEVDAPNGQEITAVNNVIIAACGRKLSPSGVTGVFDLWTSDSPSVRVVTVQFNCPFIGSNTLVITPISNSFDVGSKTPPTSGAIGDIDMTVTQKGVNAIAAPTADSTY